MGIKTATLAAAVDNGHWNQPQNSTPFVLKMVLDEGLNHAAVPEEIWDGLISIAMKAHEKCTDNPEGADAQKAIRKSLYAAIGKIFSINTGLSAGG